VARLTRRKRVWCVGASSRLKEAMKDVLGEIRTASESLRLTSFSLDEDKLADTAKFLSRIGATRIADNILLLLEEDYGPAYNRLCRILTGYVPVLLPTGLYLPAGPGLSWTPEHVGLAITQTDADLAAFLDKKRIAVCVTAGQYASCIEPALKSLGCQFHVTAMFDPDPKRRGAHHGVLEIQPPEKMSKGGFDCLITTRFFFENSKNLLYAYPVDNTPLVMLGSAESITRSSEVVLCHSLFTSPNGPLSWQEPSRQQGFFLRHYHRLYPGFTGNADKHCEELANTTYQWRLNKRAIYAVDRPGPLVNTRDGMRLTTDQPVRHDNAVYMLGKSYIYGNFNEDKDTISSCLQRICNKQAQSGAIGRQFLVNNKGLSGSDLPNMLRVLMEIALKKGDIVTLGMTPEMYTEQSLVLIKRMQEITVAKQAGFAVFLHPVPYFLDNPSEHEMEVVHFRAQQYGDPYFAERINSLFPAGNAAYRDALSAQNIPTYDLQPFFQRPHDMGEIFADTFHMVAKGNERIALVMYDAYVRNAEPVSTEGVDEIVLQDIISIVRKSARNNLTVDKWVTSVPRFPGGSGQKVGSIVMNCNPLTAGHEHIIEAALSQTDRLYIFVVEEDRSDFDFKTRFALVQEGTKEYGDRVLVVPSGQFIISSGSFPEYFSKEHIDYTPDVSFEILLFGTVIAPSLGISVRFFGEEPYCTVTRSYHEQILELLPRCGVECVVIPRTEESGKAISASHVRALLAEKNWDELEKLVPPCTMALLREWVEQKP
ncbi:hypothetical protein LJC46_09190, partial [Desulfovibrio sp. OttesenSCG-928-G15]|nr:hypothetical protein [Desulfovibrio sp. OttesenSCG-928-G15]